MIWFTFLEDDFKNLGGDWGRGGQEWKQVRKVLKESKQEMTGLNKGSITETQNFRAQEDLNSQLVNQTGLCKDKSWERERH